MKWKILFFPIICFAFSGCGDKQPKQVTVAKPKVTRTITETVKTDVQIPVTRTESRICTNTKTITSDGTAAAPLHTATVPVPQAAFKIGPNE